MQWIVSLSGKTSHCLQKYKGDNDEIFLYFLFRDFFLIKRNEISNVSLKSSAEIRSHWRVPLSKLENCVDVPPFIIHES